MTKAEREAFLADVHVGVLAVDEPGRGPLQPADLVPRRRRRDRDQHLGEGR